MTLFVYVVSVFSLLIALGFGCIHLRSTRAASLSTSYSVQSVSKNKELNEEGDVPSGGPVPCDVHRTRKMCRRPNGEPGMEGAVDEGCLGVQCLPGTHGDECLSNYDVARRVGEERSSPQAIKRSRCGAWQGPREHPFPSCLLFLVSPFAPSLNTTSELFPFGESLAPSS